MGDTIGPQEQRTPGFDSPLASDIDMDNQELEKPLVLNEIQVFDPFTSALDDV